MRHLLGYKNRPTTKNNFFADERFKKIETIFRAPEEYSKEFEDEPMHLTNTMVYRLMRLLSSLEF